MIYIIVYIKKYKVTNRCLIMKFTKKKKPKNRFLNGVSNVQ